MASVYDLKPKFQNLLRPVCAALARAGVTANQVTVAAAVLSIAEGVWITAGHSFIFGRPSPGSARASLIALPVVLFIRMALNAIDGMLAREFHQQSRLGAILNELGDVVSDTALYLPFALLLPVNPMLLAIIVILAVMSEMTGVLALMVGSPRRYDGPFGKSDRAVFFGVLALVLAFDLLPGMWINMALFLAIAAGIATIVNRARRALAAGR